jgi:glycosyltransferase involved in cell wall biosynthesis
MRVGLVTGEYPPMQGGVGDYTQALGCALAARGVDVHVLTSTRARGGATAPGLTVHAAIPRWSWPSLLRLRGLARSLRLDLLHVQYQAAAYGLSAPIHFLPSVAGVPVIVTFHDLRIPYLFPKAGRLRPASINLLARSAAGVIVTDPADEAELRRRGGVARLAQIPICSNIATAPPLAYDRAARRARLGVRAGDFLLGYFGFLNPSKGGDALISALAVLVHDRKAPVRLVLIGGATGSSDATNTEFDAQLARQIKRYDLENHLLRTGFVSAPEVSAHLLACDAVVLPYRDGASWRRGSLLAALAHGCAVITTQPAEPLPELRDGENIRLVPPDSAPALVLAVTQLLHAPELRARMGQGARDLARRFSWDTIAERTLGFYELVLGKMTKDE